MMTPEVIQKIREGLSQIMKESYPLCDADDGQISAIAARINNIAFETRQLFDHAFRN